MSFNEVIVATGNEGKAREFASLLSGVFKKVFSLKDFPAGVLPEETGETFAENSLIKAQAAFEVFCTDSSRAVLADDSGLEVYCLDGRPGVYSARYAGENSTDGENMDKLISELKDMKDRRARFVCCLTLMLPDGGKITSTGVCEGEIAEEKRGNRGFGYDPVFFLPSLGKTVAELEPEEKNLVSHRAGAARKLAERLCEIST